MKLNLQVTLQFLHLENALFCAEQCISAGAEVLEVGSTLLKKTGLHSIKILRERFADIPVIADMKASENVVQEVQAAAEAGAAFITISGAAPRRIWRESVEAGKEYKIKVIIDFRGVNAANRRFHLVPAEVDMVFLSLDTGRQQFLFADLQEASMSAQIPVGITGLSEEDNITKAISLGASTIAITFSDQSQNARDAIQKLHKTISQAKTAFPEDAIAINEQSLIKILETLAPNHICEATRHSVFLERIYPIHKYTKIIGKIATIKVWPGAQLPVMEFLTNLPPGTIVMVDAGGQGPAVWGHITTEVALKKELGGAVIHGSITDVNKIRERGFPCYASNISVSGQSSHTESEMVVQNAPLQIGNVLVQPHDWLLGDDTGVVCIPAHQAFTIACRAASLAQEKDQIARAIESGESNEIPSLLEKFAAIYEELQ